MAADVVYAELRMKLDRFKSDMNEMHAEFIKLGDEMTRTTTGGVSQFGEMGKGMGKAIDNLSKTSIGQFAKMAKGMQAALMAAPIIGIIMTIIGVVKQAFSAIANWVGETSKAYREHNAELAKMQAVLQSTGAMAWTTTRQLEEQAKALSEASTYAVTDIMKMQSVLLGFRTITGDTFTRTTQAIIDMATVMGGDLASAANTVGKAIDTPVQGMTALSRQGFIFTEEEKRMVAQMEAAGDHMKAQEVILKALEDAFKGTAAAVADANYWHATLETTTQALKKAQGEATNGFSVWWAKVRAGWKQSKLDAVEWRNAVDKATKFDYETALKDLQERISSGRYTEPVAIKMKLELDREKALHDLTLATKAAQDYFDSMLTNGFYVTEQNDKHYAQLLDQAQRMENILSLRDYDIKKADEIAAAEQARIEKLNAELALLHEQADLTSDESIRVDALSKANAEKDRAIAEAQKKRSLNLIDEKAKTQLLANAWNAYTDQIIRIGINLDNIKVKTKEALEEQQALQLAVNEAISASVVEALAYNAAVEAGNAKVEETEGQRFARERDEIVKQFNFLKKAYDSFVKERIVTEEYATQRIMAAKNQEVAALEALFARYGASAGAGNLGTTNALTQAIGEQKEMQDSLNAAKEAEENRARQERILQWFRDQRYEITKLTGDTETIQKAERSRAMMALKNSQVYKDADSFQKNLMEKMLNEYYDAKNANKIEGFWKKIGQAVQTYGAVASQAIASAIQIWTTLANKSNEEEQKRIDDWLAMNLEANEKLRQARLFEAGLAEASSEEEYQLRYDRAVESGDQLVILEAERALREFQINEEFDQKQRELEEEAAKAKAQAQYKADLAQWQGQLIMGAVNVAQSILMAFAQLGPLGGIAGAAIMAALGAVQMGAIAANKPTLKYAEGGIIPGSAFHGDRVAIPMGNFDSGEMAINRNDQQDMWNWIKSAKDNPQGGSQSVEIPIYLNGDLMTKVVVENINNRKYRISQRSLDA